MNSLSALPFTVVDNCTSEQVKSSFVLPVFVIYFSTGLGTTAQL